MAHLSREYRVWDEGRDIAVDGSGNIYVTGWSLYTWGGPLNTHSGWHDIVILKLNSSGTLVWHTFQGSAGDDDGGRKRASVGCANGSAGAATAGGDRGGEWSDRVCECWSCGEALSIRSLPCGM